LASAAEGDGAAKGGKILLKDVYSFGCNLRAWCPDGSGSGGRWVWIHSNGYAEALATHAAEAAAAEAAAAAGAEGGGGGGGGGGDKKAAAPGVGPLTTVAVHSMQLVQDSIRIIPAPPELANMINTLRSCDQVLATYLTKQYHHFTGRARHVGGSGSSDGGGGGGGSPDGETEAADTYTGERDEWEIDAAAVADPALSMLKQAAAEWLAAPGAQALARSTGLICSMMWAIQAPYILGFSTQSSREDQAAAAGPPGTDATAPLRRTKTQTLPLWIKPVQEQLSRCLVAAVTRNKDNQLYLANGRFSRSVCFISEQDALNAKQAGDSGGGGGSGSGLRSPSTPVETTGAEGQRKAHAERLQHASAALFHAVASTPAAGAAAANSKFQLRKLSGWLQSLIGLLDFKLELGSGRVLQAVVKDNRAVLDVHISESMLMSLLQLLDANGPHEPWVEFMQAVCQCEGRRVPQLQEMVLRVFYRCCSCVPLLPCPCWCPAGGTLCSGCAGLSVF
jgi:hypothetical protein